VCYALAFPKFGLSILCYFFLVPLLWLTDGDQKGSPFKLFFFFSFIANLIILYWIPDVMVYYGGMNRILGMAGIFILSAYIALFHGLAGLLIQKALLRDLKAMVLIPSAWVAKDFILEVLFGGFPWEFAGYSQYRNVWLSQLAEIGGVHGITFLIILFNVLFYLLIKKRKLIFLILPVFFLVLSHGSGYILFTLDHRSESGLPESSAGIIQPNTGQVVSGHGPRRRITLDDLFTESIELKEQGADFVIWPEYTIGLAPLQNRSLYMRFQDFSLNHVPLFAGFTDYRGPDEMYNSIMLFDNGRFQKYDKFRLVPFGEYIPFKDLFFFINKITDEISDFTPGKGIFNLEVLGEKVSTPICYEIIYSRIVRDFIHRGGKAIILISNDSWYGTSSAPYQLLSMSVFRSIENRRYILRSTSNGISAVIDPRGKIIKRVPLNVKDSFVSRFIFRERETIFTRYGFLFPWLSVLVVLLSMILPLIRRIKNRSRGH